jgi:predicted acylesterase/phospholipase RssA
LKKRGNAILFRAHLALLLLAIGSMGLGLAGCSSTGLRLDAVPSGVGAVSFLRIPNARFDGDDGEALKEEIWQSLTREWPRLSNTMLALSGGQENGAFGAGLLVGWSERGNRPQFKIVTGTSTGALAAPFAFLGSEYDWALRKIYTETKPGDVIGSKRSLLSAVNSDALMDNGSLAQSINKYLDIKILDRIAQEYDKGRLLLVSTTNLDTGRLIIWNIGAIANSGHPKRLELVRKVLLASAAIPGMFPPVMIDVTLDQARHQEMHVDGGTVSQIFLYPPSLQLGGILQRSEGGVRPTVYLIRNGRAAPEPENVERKTLAIAGRAIETMIASNGVGDIYRIYTTAQRDQVDFNLALIADDFKHPYVGPFDRAYMTKLFEHGLQKGRRGYPWQKVPPGYTQ